MLEGRQPKLERLQFLQLSVESPNILWCLSLQQQPIVAKVHIMLSKTELWPANDRLKEAGRHLAFVKGSLKHLKRVEDKQIVNDLVGAIEAQREAVEQMLQVLDTVARHNFHPEQVQEIHRIEPPNGKEARNRRTHEEFSVAVQGHGTKRADQVLISLEQPAE